MSILKAHDLVIQRGGRFKLGPLSFELGESESLAIVGKNGSGKSSLMMSLIGKLKIQSGTLDIQSQKVGFVGLAPLLFRSWTVGRFANFVGSLAGARIQASETLDRFLDRKVQELSQGQFRAVELEIMLSLPFQLYFLDEAFTHLDEEKRGFFRKKIEGKMSQGSSFVMSFHQETELQIPFQRKLVL